MARKPRTAKDFPPEFLDAWNLALEGKLMLSMDTIGQARNMIQQMYIFRKRLLEESPELGSKFMMVDLRVHDEEGRIITGKPTAVPQKAIIKPFVSTWKEQIRQQAGVLTVAPTLPIIEVNPAQDFPLLALKTDPHEPNDTFEETLSNLGYSTEGEQK